MNKDEYIIINKIAIQNRIEKLKNKRDNEHKKGHDKSALRYENTIIELKGILSQSIPLIPEVEKLIVMSSISNIDFLPDRVEKIKQDYVSNLKLDI